MTVDLAHRDLCVTLARSIELSQQGANTPHIHAIEGRQGALRECVEREDERRDEVLLVNVIADSREHGFVAGASCRLIDGG